ncbi:MAG: CcmD family protein [Terriglobia bacterium]
MNNYLVAAYAVLWIVLLVYTFLLARKCKRLTEELEQLKQRIEQEKR